MKALDSALAVLDNAAMKRRKSRVKPPVKYPAVLGVSLTREMYDQLERTAASASCSMSAVVRRALAEHFGLEVASMRRHRDDEVSS